MKELVAKANEQIKRLKAWYEEHRKAFDSMNLKLYDVSYYCCKEMEKDFPLCYANDSDGNYCEYSYFYMFCEQEYDSMVEFLAEEHNIQFKDFHHSVGRTSSFYLHNQNIFQFESFQLNWFWTMNQILNELYVTYYSNYTEFNKDGSVNFEKLIQDIEKYSMDKDMSYERLKNELEWLATEMYDEVVKYFDDMLTVYDYISDFKENQVKNFKDWLQFYEDELAEEKRKEEEYEDTRQNLIAKFENSVLREILNTYVPSNEAIEKLLATV